MREEAQRPVWACCSLSVEQSSPLGAECSQYLPASSTLGTCTGSLHVPQESRRSGGQVLSLLFQPCAEVQAVPWLLQVVPPPPHGCPCSASLQIRCPWLT